MRASVVAVVPGTAAPRPDASPLAFARAMVLCGALVFGFTGAALAESLTAAPTGPAGENVLVRLLREDALAFENGEGVPRDGAKAAELYCKAARMGDAQSQFNLGWMYSNGRGVERNDSAAAFFFHAAAEQGLPQAIRMLKTVGGPSGDLPACMQPPPAAPVSAQVRPSRGPESTASLVVPPAATPNIVELVKRSAAEFNVPPQLVLAIIEAESNFNVAAVSPRNAQGLMQLIPETAARFNVSRPFDAAQNIRGGTAYLRWLLDYFAGDVALVAAAYNAGEGTVNRYRGVPPYAETLAYVGRILRRVGSTELPFDSGAVNVSPMLRQVQAVQQRGR